MIVLVVTAAIIAMIAASHTANADVTVISRMRKTTVWTGKEKEGRKALFCCIHRSCCDTVAMMATFRTFDALARNDFWTAPVDDIWRGLEKNMHKDQKMQSGVSLVIGCPLPENIQSAIAKLAEEFESILRTKESDATVRWREDFSALHITVYGLVLPKDYHAESSWQLMREQKDTLRHIVAGHDIFPITLQGIGVLGRGALSVRVSDSPEIERLRDAIAHVPGVSPLSFGGRTTKIVIGRIAPGMTEQDRTIINDACAELQDFEIGTIDTAPLTMVHYAHTFLDRCMDKEVV